MPLIGLTARIERSRKRAARLGSFERNNHGLYMSKNNPATAPTAALKTQIIIVGGGAGGLELGAKYGRKRHDIILVERNRTHIWKPLLHEVADWFARRQPRRGRLSQSLPPLGISLLSRLSGKHRSQESADNCRAIA